MESTRKKRRGGLIALLVIVLLLALVCAAPFIYNATVHFAYDDYEKLADGAGELFDLSAENDGAHLLFHMDQNSVYRLLAENGALVSAEKELGGRAVIEQIGYDLRCQSDESVKAKAAAEGHASGSRSDAAELEVRAAVKLFGFLPAQLRGLADVSVVDAQTLRVVPREVRYGDRIRLSPEKLAKWTGMPELAEGFDLSLSDWTTPLRADKVYLEGMGLAIASPLLAEVIDEVAAIDETEIRLLRLYEGDLRCAAQAVFEGGSARANFIDSAGASYGTLVSALRDVCAYGSDEYRCRLIDELSGFPVDLTFGLKEFPRLRQAQIERVAEAQAAFAEAQLSLRHDYWYKNVTLTASHLLGMEGTPLEARLPADWEARVVLMYNVNYDAIVKTSEGNPRLQEPIPGLPMLSELPRDSWASVPKNDNGPFDLTLALRLPSGIPAVVFLTAEDEFGLAVIPEELFAELRDSPTLPICSSGDVMTAPRDQWLRVTGLRDDLPAANYIGVP